LNNSYSYLVKIINIEETCARKGAHNKATGFYMEESPQKKERKDVSMLKDKIHHTPEKYNA
tara:strand:+ start:109899 stop:110081 length:183 start_codon:yes stop_codon:yes gene_type:complete